MRSQGYLVLGFTTIDCVYYIHYIPRDANASKIPISMHAGCSSIIMHPIHRLLLYQLLIWIVRLPAA